MAEAALTLSVHDVAILQVAALPGAFDRVGAALGAALGTAIPERPGIAAMEPPVFWAGPGRWWVPSRERDAVKAIAEEDAVLTELGAGLRRLSLRGPSAAELLARGCSIDLTPAAFPPGSFARTPVARIAVLIHARPDGTAFDLYTPRSHAAWLARWIEDAALTLGGLERP